MACSSNRSMGILWIWWWCTQDKANLAMSEVKWSRTITTTCSIWLISSLSRPNRHRTRRTSTSSTCPIYAVPLISRECSRTSPTEVAELASRACHSRWESSRSRAWWAQLANNNRSTTMSSSRTSRCRAVRPPLASTFQEDLTLSALLAVICQLHLWADSQITTLSQP